MAKKKPAAESADEEHVTTTFRVTREQWAALRREALELALQRGSGRPDASEALRAILDGWMKGRR
jgi:hypothetical protein